MRAAARAAGMIVTGDCGSAAEAIESVARTRPDVCILDRELPGGALAAAAAIATPRRTPQVLVVGGRGSDAERRAALLAGATDYLPGEADGTRLAAAVAASKRRST
jgi:DNA-binding NarL/FixJ family response regulator